MSLMICSNINKGHYLISYYGLYSSRTPGGNAMEIKLKKFKAEDTAQDVPEKEKSLEIKKEESKSCMGTICFLLFFHSSVW